MQGKKEKTSYNSAKRSCVVVLGGGESGVGAALLAKEQGYSVFVSDFGKISEHYRNLLLSHEISFEESGHNREKILKADVVVKSPGIPDKAPIVQLLQKSGTEIISEIEWAYRFAQAPVLAITGTNGKTTTTLLLNHILNRAGFKILAVGNIGKSFAHAVAEEPVPDAYILEVSSFQLDNINTFSPAVAAVLNITPDHLDRYGGSMEAYADAKLQISAYQKEENFLILPVSSGVIERAVTRNRPKSKILRFSNSEQTDSFFKEGKLGFSFEGNKCVLSEEKMPLQGPHNMLNIAAAGLCALAFGLPLAKLSEALKGFEGADHRLQEVEIKRGVRYVNDSKATNVEAALYALRSFEEGIIWIAGGTDKGNDYELLSAEIHRVKALICLGKDNQKLKNFFAEKVKVIRDTHNMKDALKAASALGLPGDTVLLSPACASFDLFLNYEDRGRQFTEEVSRI